MKKKFSFITISLILIIIWTLTGQVQAAGSFVVSKSSVSLTEGETTTFNVSVSNCEGKFTISSSDSSIVKVSSGAVWPTEQKAETITITALKAGTATITVTATDVADNSTEPQEVTGSKSISVTVKAKSTSGSNSGSGNNTGGSTTKPSTPTTTAPKFTSVNETVYATDDGINVRKSYSTSSKALGSLKKGESIKRTGIATTKTSDGITWSKVTYNGQIAYVSSSYLTKTKPAEDKPKTEEPKENTTSNEEVNNTTSEENNETTNNEIDNNNTVENTTTTDGSLGLSSLEIAGVNFSDGFDPNKHSYGLKLNFYVKSLDITTKANKEGAKIEIIGNHDFVEGENNVTILLTSADGNETATYQIKVTVPSEVATAPQNNIQFYLTCGSAIVIAIIVIAIITAIYRKVSNGSKNDKDEYKTNEESNIEDPYTELKPKKERSKGKHSN